MEKNKDNFTFSKFVLYNKYIKSKSVSSFFFQFYDLALNIIFIQYLIKTCMNHNLAQSPLIYGGYMIFSPAVFLFRIFMGLAQFDIIG